MTVNHWAPFALVSPFNIFKCISGRFLNFGLKVGEAILLDARAKRTTRVGDEDDEEASPEAPLLEGSSPAP